MCKRQLQVGYYCVGIITIIFLDFTVGVKTFRKVKSQKIFDPSFMDPGNFNAEKPYSGTDTCTPEVINCNASYPYPTYDGTCNNLAHPMWGKAEDCHPRILEAHYEGFDDLRRSVLGGPLPLPRSMTLQEFGYHNRPTRNLTFFFTIFGQLVSHEMTRVDMQGVFFDKCCEGEKSKNTSFCMPFIFPPGDPYYSKFNLTCFDLRRSLTCPRCISDKKQSTNSATAFLDGSLFYDNSEERALYLRAMDGTGRMKVTSTEFGELLLTGLASNDQFCPGPIRNKNICFDSGDPRVNQHSPLISITTLFVREHNLLADKLRKLNPHWDDEKIFQEAKRIMTAELQNIVYAEYLPVLLGTAYMSHYNLSVQTKNKGTQYDPSVRVGIWVEFSTTVFRLHSMIPTRTGFDHRRFKYYYGNVQLLREGKMDDLLHGSCTVPSQKNDNWFSKDVTDHLYQDKYSPLGEDLVALDILRGRDNGIAPYADMLFHLTKGRLNVTKFEDLKPIMTMKNIKRLKKLYKDVRDVDLFAGTLLENRVPGLELGPTAAAIIAMQFNNIKFGDRFYFEHESQAGSFTKAQRKNLKKVTLSRLLCDNLRIQKIQKNALYLESETNPMVNCDEIAPSLDLSPWEEKMK